MGLLDNEIAVTTHGLFTVDVQGLLGSKKEYKYFPLKGVKYVSYESAGTFDADADIQDSEVPGRRRGAVLQAAEGGPGRLRWGLERSGTCGEKKGR